MRQAIDRIRRSRRDDAADERPDWVIGEEITKVDDPVREQQSEGTVRAKQQRAKPRFGFSSSRDPRQRWVSASFLGYHVPM